jgi:predicted transcriptional regulator
VSMPVRSASQKDKIRLTLDLSPELNNLLEELASAIGATKSDVLRKSIGLMEVAIDAKRNGKKLGVVEKDQPMVTQIVGL